MVFGFGLERLELSLAQPWTPREGPAGCDDLLLDVAVFCGGFSGRDQVWVHSGAWAAFLVAFRELERARQGSAVLTSLLPNEFRARFFVYDRAGHPAVEGDLLGPGPWREALPNFVSRTPSSSIPASSKRRSVSSGSWVGVPPVLVDRVLGYPADDPIRLRSDSEWGTESSEERRNSGGAGARLAWNRRRPVCGWSRPGSTTSLRSPAGPTERGGWSGHGGRFVAMTEAWVSECRHGGGVRGHASPGPQNSRRSIVEASARWEPGPTFAGGCLRRRDTRGGMPPVMPPSGSRTSLIRDDGQRQRKGLPAVVPRETRRTPDGFGPARRRRGARNGDP